MRPTVNSTQKQNTTRKKNQKHWSIHKRQIISKRKQKYPLKRLQRNSFNCDALENLTMDDALACLSINEKPNDMDGTVINETTSDIDFENEYFNDIEEDDINSDFDIKDQLDSNEDDIEKNINEEQVNFANEFFDTENWTEPMRDYDELVSIKFSDSCA